MWSSLGNFFNEVAGWAVGLLGGGGLLWWLVERYRDRFRARVVDVEAVWDNDCKLTSLVVDFENLGTRAFVLGPRVAISAISFGFDSPESSNRSKLEIELRIQGDRQIAGDSHRKLTLIQPSQEPVDLFWFRYFRITFRAHNRNRRYSLRLRDIEEFTPMRRLRFWKERRQFRRPQTSHLDGQEDREGLDDPCHPRITYRRQSSNVPTAVIRGTRLSVKAVVVAAHRWGWSSAEIAEQYGVTAQQVKAALRFYDDHRREIDADLATEAEIEEQSA